VLRIVPDPGVLIAALISSKGAPAELLRRWVRGDFQFVVSPSLLAELRAVAEREKFRTYLPVETAHELVHLLVVAADAALDVISSSQLPDDDGDGYLVHLVVSSNSFAVVTGDGELRRHVADDFSAVTPRELIDILERLESIVD
jgi:putative PIN family toxin of toxin-antitoxin system